MKDFLTLLAKLVPRYLDDFGECVRDPKGFTHRRRGEESAKESSWSFLVVSMALTTLISVLLQDSQANMFREFAAALVVGAFAMLSYSSAIWLSWRVVGGKSEWIDFFVVYVFTAGVFVVGFTFVIAASLGVRALDQQFPYRDEAANVVLAVGLLAGVAWSLRSWSAFRDITRAARPRSIMAYLVMLFLSVPAGLLVAVVARALQ